MVSLKSYFLLNAFPKFFSVAKLYVSDCNCSLLLCFIKGAILQKVMLYLITFRFSRLMRSQVSIFHLVEMKLSALNCDLNNHIAVLVQ